MQSLKICRAKAKETQAEVASAIGVDRTTYAKYESGASEPSFEILSRLANHFNVSRSYLFGDPASTGRTVVPVYGDVAAGIPIEAIENIVDYEEIDGAMAANGEYFGLRVRGSSMEPRIREGDVVIVKKQDYADTGDTAIVLVNGDSATVKRIKKEPAGITLIPNNPAYDAIFFSREDIEKKPVRIIGKVVELRAKF